MIEIRYVKLEDKDFWYSLDKHLPEAEFEKKFGIKGVMFSWKRINLLLCCVIIFFGITHHFAQCYLLIGTFKKKDMAKN